MSIVTYTIKLLEPLLATGMEGDPNTKRSLAFIPGSMIRGAAIGLYLQQKVPSTGWTVAMLDNDDVVERRYFLSDQTRFLNAYPLVDTTGYGDRQRSLPTPRSWLADKNTHWSAARKGQIAVDVNDFAIAQRVVDGVQWTSVKDDFFTLTDSRLLLHSPTRRVALHTARDRKMGRATTAEGAVFYYDALAAGQYFTGFIITTNDDDATYLVNLLNDREWSLGASRSAGYGSVLITAETVTDAWAGELPQPFNANEHDWPTDAAASTATPILQPGALLQILCLSHCIVRTDEGHFTAELDDVLHRKLGLPHGALQRVPEQTHRTLLKVGGFNRTWGLPISQSQAIAAGSVFVYRLTQPLAVKQLSALESTGIGEQRLDGYGRVVVNRLNAPGYQYYDTCAIELPDDDEAPTIDPETLPLLLRMGQRMLRLELDRLLLTKIQQSSFYEQHTKQPPISKSQLSRLRLAVRTALERLYTHPSDLSTGHDKAEVQQQQTEARRVAYQPVQHFLDTLRPSAREQLRRTRLIDENGPRLESWLRQRLQNSFFDTSEPPSVHLGSTTVTIPPAWDLEYTLRWIDGILAQAAKKMANAEASAESDEEGEDQ